jgi:hypothetical protein
MTTGASAMAAAMTSALETATRITTDRAGALRPIQLGGAPKAPQAASASRGKDDARVASQHDKAPWLTQRIESERPEQVQKRHE